LAVSVAECGSLDLEALPIAVGDVRLELEEVEEGIRPVLTAGSGGGVVGGAVLFGPYDLEGDEPVRAWRQGYQSWSWSGVVDLEPLETDAIGLPTVGGDGDALSAAFETPWTSWWAGLLGRPDGASVHVGATRATRTRVWMGFTSEGLVVVWGGRGERIVLNSGESVALDPIEVRFGSDPHQLWDDWARTVADKMEARVSSTPPPVGWSSWYQAYTDIDEQTVRDNLESAQELDWADATRPVFQIDDGWQARWGEWKAGQGFPSGMRQLADDIEEAGFRPGLWMAPFYVDRDAPAYRNHPNWWVRDRSGTELAYTNLGTGDYAVLDVTHPEAAAWLSQQVAGRVAQGWTYLKLDFLCAGAQEGLRYQPVTGVEAYRIGLELIRDAAGESTWLLASGAPLLPTVGFADSFRSGSDIALETSPDPKRAFLRWQARQTAARGWANGIWWWNDADAVLVREPFTLEEATGAVVANALSGGVWFLGDDLTELSSDRLHLALHPGLLPIRGSLTRPHDPLAYPSGIDAGPIGEQFSSDDQVPPVWELADGYIGLFNAGDTSITVVAPPGLELVSGRRTELPSERELAPGYGEVWRPEP
jgi:alpha-galactosidase